MGLLRATTRIDVLVNEEKGGIDVVTKIINDCGSDIINVAVDSQSSKKVYYFRLENCDSELVVNSIKKAGHEVLSVME